MPERIGILCRELWRLRTEIAAALDAEPVRLSRRPGRVDRLLGWGGRPGDAASRLARLSGLPFQPVAIGPLRSVKPVGEPPMSLVLPHAVEARLQPGEASEGLALLRRLRLSWRNDGRDPAPETNPVAATRDAALVVVRRRPSRWPRPTAPDLDAAARLVSLARAADRRRPVAVISDSREPAALAEIAASRVGGALPAAGLSPWTLFDRVTEIFAEDGDLRVLGRLAGVPVAASSDAGEAAQAPSELFRSRFLDDVVWFDAWSRRPTSFAEAADQLAWLRDRHAENDRRSICVGVSGWKARRVGAFLDGPDGPPLRVRGVNAAIRCAREQAGRVVAWETRMPASLPRACRAASVPLGYLEDGFLRSVGLGATFLPGSSITLDDSAPYYDPARQSDLERLLTTAEFTPDLVARACALRERTVALGLSKYNVGRRREPLSLPADRPVILVTGQVEDDASVQLGARGAVRSNIDLLRDCRRRNPDAYLIWKPHPDVEAGLRAGAVAPAAARDFADAVASDQPIADLLARVNVLETMTSLAGFEALLRGCRVVTHGEPFYAGWGLTVDLCPPPRRVRRLTLDELVAGALILYPRYLDPATGLRCPPEILVERLASLRAKAERAPGEWAARHAYARLRHRLFDGPAAAYRRLKGVGRATAADLGR